MTDGGTIGDVIMEKLTFLKLAEKVLSEENRPLTHVEIWDFAVSKGYNKQISTQGKTPWQTIGARLYVDIKENPNSIFVRMKTKPVRFFLKRLIAEGQLVESGTATYEKSSKPSKLGFLEKDLYPFVTYYCYYYMNVYTKRIMHEKSDKKSKYLEWLHPDLVGVYFPVNDWEIGVIDLSKETGASVLRLYSFEVKRELGFGNLRESFFQAVSNSTWANEGYLAAALIDEDKEFKQELKRLSNAFGIGVIRLDINDPDSSEVIFQARYKSDIDWETVNKLAEENPDFKEFILRVRKDFSGNEIWKEQYDKLFEPERLIESIKLK